VAFHQPEFASPEVGLYHFAQGSVLSSCWGYVFARVIKLNCLLSFFSDSKRLGVLQTGACLASHITAEVVPVTVLFCFVLFCFVLFCFVLFCFVLFCFVLFCFVSRQGFSVSPWLSRNSLCRPSAVIKGMHHHHLALFTFQKSSFFQVSPQEPPFPFSLPLQL
jgi:hypothetical protein